jgi:hypothetical protein
MLWNCNALICRARNRAGIAATRAIRGENLMRIGLLRVRLIRSCTQTRKQLTNARN